MNNLGKLKRTLQKPCPDCGNKVLQVRVVTEEIHCKGEDEEPDELKNKILEEEIQPRTREVEYLYCPRCEEDKGKYTGKKSRKYNQREEEEDLWTLPPKKNYEKNCKGSPKSQSTTYRKK